MNIEESIHREKMKSGSRQKKVELVEKRNKEWKDFSDSIL